MLKTSSAQTESPSPMKSSDVQAAPTSALALKHNQLLTTHSVVQLQRVLGNQGIQRLIASQGKAAPSIQRAGPTTSPPKSDQGLMEQDASSRFAQKMFDFVNNPLNKKVTVPELIDEMQTALKDELDIVDLPFVPISFGDAQGARACFDWRPWSIEINAENVFGGQTVLISDLDTSVLTEAVGTAYHEGRHAEQFFKIAQLYAMELSRAGVKTRDIRISMKKHLALPFHVIDAAIAHPLDADLDPAIVEKIKLWTTSVFGADKEYRSIVYDMRDEVLSGLSCNIQAVLEFIPENYAQLLPDEQAVIAQQVPLLSPPVDTHVVRLRQYRNKTLQPQIERVRQLPVNSPTDHNMRMLDHLTMLAVHTDAIAALMPLTAQPETARERAVNIEQHLTAMSEELVLADYHLPEQDDAESAEAEVEKAFAGLLSKK